jgi:two-component sensor histidine kinase/PAS domain-containing protein
MSHGQPLNSLAEAIVETIREPLVVLDGELRVTAINPAFLEHFNVDAADTFGRHVCELGNGQWNIASLRRLLDEMLTTNSKITGLRVEHDFDVIGRRVMLLNANRMRRENLGDTILLVIDDITERERLRFELEGQKEFAEKLIDSVRESLVVLGWDLRVHFANQSFYDHFAVTPEETKGLLVYELGNGQWNIPELRQLLEDILPKQNFFDDYEVHHEFEKIGPRTMLFNARRLDHLNLFLLAIRDITEERRHEFHQQVLLGELQHRVKNVLNSVLTLARQTRKRSRSFEDFFVAFEARLDALARIQDLVMTSPSGANLGDIVRMELEAIGAEVGRNFTMDGPAVLLPPREAQSMTMTVHELATNAAKYGALKADHGQIEIKWRTDPDRRNYPTHLEFDWQEHGVGIEDLAPARGFGSEVIERSLPHMLGGAAKLTFERDGVVCRLELPLPD